MTELYKFVKKQTHKIPNISYRKIYGLDSFYLGEKPFVVILKSQEIAIKIEDFEVRDNTLKSTQATQWILDGKPMDNWFVLPATYNKKKSKLNPILETTSKALVHPRKKKKKSSKKIKVKDQIFVEKKNPESKNTSTLKKIFNFFIQK